MRPRFISPLPLIVATAMLAIPATSPAQEAIRTTSSQASVVPQLIKYSGAMSSAPGKASTVDVTFALYAAPTGGEALWSETQQVALDSSGKYSVLLGSVTALPNAAFANGAAKWIGVTLAGQEESARTILVATPYSLKASDAETLGGHPVSDFTLKNALPASGTNITQINVGSGLTGGGTGPTVALGLSSSYLETLGNGIYPQLGGTNKLTGKNTYTAGNLLLGTSPVLSAASVTGTSPVTATISGNTVKIGLSDSALLTLGNGVYAQLGAANTFTAGQTFKSAVTFASGQSFPGTVALGANNAFTGTNSFSKAITFAAGQTFPGTGAGTITGITTTSPLSGSGTSGTVALSLNTSALETTLNSTYPTLTASNTFGGNNTFTGDTYTGSIDATGQIYVYAPESGTYTVVGSNTDTLGGGVYGSGSNTGVAGYSTDSNAGDSTVGVYGQANTLGQYSAGVEGFATEPGTGVYGDVNGHSGEGGADQTFFEGIGVWADTNRGGATALLTTADDTYSALFFNNSPSGYATLNIESDDSTAYAWPLYVYNKGTGTGCHIDGHSNFACSGTFASMNPVDQDRKVATYAVQSSENWIEDAGAGQITFGHGHVTLDPAFVATVNTGMEYRVFLTPNGDSKGLYVTSKTADSFDVVESGGGHSSIAFDYRIMAKRKGFEFARLVDVTADAPKPLNLRPHKTLDNAAAPQHPASGPPPLPLRAVAVSHHPVTKPAAK